VAVTRRTTSSAVEVIKVLPTPATLQANHIFPA